MTTLTATPTPPIPATVDKAAKAPITDEEFLRLRDEGGRYELVDGKLEETKMSVTSMYLANLLAIKLNGFIQAPARGVALVEVSFRCFAWSPRQIRVPDVAYLSAPRLSQYNWGQSFVTVRPDLVAEIVSPNESASVLEGKVSDYQRAGVERIWVIHPDRRLVRVHGKPGDLSELVGQAVLTDDSLLPGFELPLEQLFDVPGQAGEGDRDAGDAVASP